MREDDTKAAAVFAPTRLSKFHGSPFTAKLYFCCISGSRASGNNAVFLSKVDRLVKAELEGRGLRVFRYVDDYLVLGNYTEIETFSAQVVGIFTLRGGGLNFTYEMPKEKSLQFLDVQFTFEERHLCWQYSPRTEKPLLEYTSGHSRIVKNGIVMGCLKSVLDKICKHRMEEAFGAQKQRLEKAGHRSNVLLTVSERLLKRVKMEAKEKEKRAETKDKSMSVIPYVYGLSHRLKKAAARYNVNVVFSAKNKVGSVCPAVNRLYEERASSKTTKCTMSHTYIFLECRNNVVYKIPVRWANEQMRKCKAQGTHVQP